MTKTQAQPIRLTIALIKAIADECTRLGSPLLVVKFGQFLYPEDIELGQASEQIQLAMSKVPQTRYLDLDQEFVERGISQESLLVGNDDGHWNEYGHQAVAMILREYMLSEKLLKDSIAGRTAPARAAE